MAWGSLGLEPRRSGESPRFHCAHSHPAACGSANSVLPGRTQTQSGGLASPGRWLGQEFTQFWPGCPIEGPEGSRCWKRSGAPLGTSAGKLYYNSSRELYGSAGRGPGSGGSGHPPAPRPAAPTWEHPSTSARCSAASSVLSACSSLRMGRGVIVVPVFGAPVSGTGGLPGWRGRSSEWLEDRLGVRLGPAPRDRGSVPSFTPKLGDGSNSSKAWINTSLVTPELSRALREFLLERRSLDTIFQGQRKKGVRGRAVGAREGGGEFHKLAPSPGTPPTLQPPDTCYSPGSRSLSERSQKTSNLP